jgi:hypothetical protein
MTTSAHPGPGAQAWPAAEEIGDWADGGGDWADPEYAALAEKLARRPPHQPEAVAGHVDQAAASRWHQAQTELASLIREGNRLDLDQPAAGRGEPLPGSLADWMARRVRELEEAEAGRPEAEA